MENLVRVKNLNTDGQGLEIAPYFNPALPRSKYNVMYTDYLSNDEIQEKAKQNPGAAGKEIPFVDFVWSPGKALKQCAPADLLFDYALASHVMEHVPDPIGWVNDVLSVLRVGGVFRIVLPNAERSNDYFRARTSFSQVVALWLEKPAVPTPFQVCDFMAYSLDDDGNNTFDENGNSKYTRPHYTLEQAISTAQFVHNEMHYIDVHCTVWTVASFKDVFEKASALGLLNVEIELVDSSMFEFTMDLKKLGEPTLTRAVKATPSVLETPGMPASEHSHAVLQHTISGLEFQLQEANKSLQHATNAFHECAAELRKRETAPEGRASDPKKTISNLEFDLQEANKRFEHATNAFHECAAELHKREIQHAQFHERIRWISTFSKLVRYFDPRHMQRMRG